MIAKRWNRLESFRGAEMKTSELLAKVEMKPVSRGRDLEKAGWADGYLVVKFRGKPAIYIYGAAIAEDQLHKILKVPFPDALLRQLRTKFNWQCMKIEVKS